MNYLIQKKDLVIKSWQEASKNLQRTEEKPWIENIDRIAEKLKVSGKNYVYILDFGFGEEIISQGKAFITSRNHLNFPLHNDFNVGYSEFSEDICYSLDPLSMVLENFCEVHGKNWSKTASGFKVKQYEYPVPLNIIEQGELMGIFGTLDNLCFGDNFEETSDWCVTSGRVSFCLTLPEKGETLKQNKKLRVLLEDYYDSDDSRSNIPILDKHIRLIQSIMRDSGISWNARVIYFPRHFFKSELSESKRLIELIQEIGWKQISPLKKMVFEDRSIWDLLANAESKGTIKSYFFSFFYDFLLQAAKGYQYLLVLKENGTDVLSDCLNIINESELYKAKTGCKVLLFTFDKLKKPGQWGICPVFYPPVVNYFESISLYDIIKSLEVLNRKILNHPNEGFEYLEKFEGYHTDKYWESLAGSSIRYNGVFKSQYLAEFIKNENNLEDPKRINLEHPFFQSFLVIKRIK